MNSEMFKIHMIQYVSITCVFIINAILAYSFYQLVLVSNIHNVMNFTFKLSDFFFFFFSLYVLIANIRIPFYPYDNEHDFNEQMSYELSDITGHIFLSAFATGSLVIAMYCFNTY